MKYIWTSGRLCDFDGCDRPDFFPKSVNGWFWSANQARLSPTNCTQGQFGCFQDWSFTGGLVQQMELVLSMETDLALAKG